MENPLETMGKYGKIWQNMRKYGKIIGKYGKVWGNMGKIMGKIPELRMMKLLGFFDGHVRFTGHIMELT
jgi:hypothetical protein